MLPLTTRTKELFAPLRMPFDEKDRLEIASSDDGNFVFDFYRIIYDVLGKPIRSMCSSTMLKVRDRLPECFNCKGDKYFGYYAPHKVACTDCTVEIITQLVPEQHITFLDDDAQNNFKYIQATSACADYCSQVMAQYKTDASVPTHGYELNADKPLLPYQQVALCCQQAQDGFGLFMEQGTGKTPIGVASTCNGAVAHRANGGYGYYKVLVVCPINLLRNWKDEYENFTTRPGRVTILRGTAAARIGLLCDAFAPPTEAEDDLFYSVVLCSYDTLRVTWETLKMVDWDLSILDEAHAIKNVKAMRTDVALTLRDHSKQRMILTGTPVSNNPLDVYTLLEFMDKNGSGFSSYKEFRKYFGTMKTVGGGRTILSGYQNLPFLQERLLRKGFWISKKEALPHLPPQTFDVIEVEMPSDQREAYNQLADQLALEIENDMANDTMSRQMLVQCILTKLLRLSQITSGFVTWDKIQDPDSGEIIQPSTYEYFSPNPKIDAIMELLAEKDETEKTIIWANWIPDIEYLSHACTHFGYEHAVFRGLHKGYKEHDREEAKRRFNEDRSCRIFIGTQGSGGSGLNLLGYPPHRGDEYETDATHAIYMSQDWSYVKRDQSVARNHRNGTRRPVRYTTIIATDSIDEEIHDRVSGKKSTALEVANLSKLIDAVLNRNKVAC